MDLFFIAEVSLNNSFEASLSAPSLLCKFARDLYCERMRHLDCSEERVTIWLIPTNGTSNDVALRHLFALNWVKCGLGFHLHFERRLDPFGTAPDRGRTPS